MRSRSLCSQERSLRTRPVSGAKNPSSGDGNHSVTGSDTAGFSEAKSPTTASGPEVPPALGSATRTVSPWVLRAVAVSVLSRVAVIVTAAGRELTRIGRHSQVTPVALGCGRRRSRIFAHWLPGNPDRRLARGSRAGRSTRSRDASPVPSAVPCGPQSHGISIVSGRVVRFRAGPNGNDSRYRPRRTEAGSGFADPSHHERQLAIREGRARAGASRRARTGVGKAPGDRQRRAGEKEGTSRRSNPVLAEVYSQQGQSLRRRG